MTLWLFAVGGLLGVLVGLAMLLMGGAMFAENMGIFAVIAIVIGVAELVVAYGIWNMKKWARIVGIILAVIGLINIPIGTIISIVILYFLLIDKNTKDLFTE
ncbi:MAG: hypothetical protein GW779_01860 [Candidatus Altiarchaeum hamiconexum]|uniref:Uncharacterized protein n=1 Tax=Candidatus Altarchaeum hamiconexum TaxID=1803513 RepID=A0A8J7Z0E3_9ARCH|nr:hypothetical protein [Candidatus Altarchaeum hamiconexum]NCN68847.1 hypothetical protein [Candidatus Altarchaeum hamiconexum]NCS91155.1 hypothetical protein [Candidatus Altarchaeum hamiconexum]PIZ30779.1 MAG: hypothetical protein COY41_03665 [Candidatus Altarchaeum sp. CG_4_10_14_0_8_um_filter_32_851]